MVDEGSETSIPWAGAERQATLEQIGFETLKAAASLVPEISVVALVLERARRRSLAYPVQSREELEELLEGEELRASGHIIKPETIRTFVVTADFPLEHEGELAALVYAALGRCNSREQLRAALAAFDNQLNEDVAVTEA